MVDDNNIMHVINEHVRAQVTTKEKIKETSSGPEKGQSGRDRYGGYSYNVFFSSRRRHTRLQGDWSSDVCSSDLPGDKLPSLRELAQLHRYAKNTVVSAFDLLVSRGIVEPRRGSGFYVLGSGRGAQRTDEDAGQLGRAMDIV